MSYSARSSGGRHPDPQYAARCEGAFVVAVNCGQAGGTCFCVSMDAGPRATSGFDLALTELTETRQFLAENGVPDLLLLQRPGRIGTGREDPQRRRSWDSCFTMDHSYLHGGPVRVLRARAGVEVPPVRHRGASSDGGEGQ